jgi:putative transcriptional regulator
MQGKLVEAREAVGLTQEAVASAAGISRSFYTQIEGGSRTPSLKVAFRIAAVLGKNPNDIFLPAGDATGNTDEQAATLDPTG